ncbi:MAG: glucosyl-3-phosphoglycerate synthase [Acidimicrobiia bacterium]|nr:glucosyl-3-phosphoglycerate synthase [Acidimicrobiia bacterium]
MGNDDQVSILRTLHHGDFDLGQLGEAKGDLSVSVCLPAHNEAATVGSIVATIVDQLGPAAAGLVDEVLVLDDHSTDATAAVAAGAGARVVTAGDVLPEFGDGHGKGQALWKSLYASEGDLVVWCDADVTDFDAGFVTGLVGTLLCEPDVVFVKGFYDRPLRQGAGGGRVTELVARPAVALLHPELTPFVQPLAGEYAGRRHVLERLPFVGGYGVDLALLIDVAARYGLGAMAQVDLGVRVHRNRSLDELGPQAMAVLQAALARATPDRTPASADLLRPDKAPVRVDMDERPPLIEVPAYERRTA